MSRVRIVAVATLVSLLAIPAMAIGADPATITGTLVDDQSGDPIAGCTMSAHNEPFNPGEWRLLFSWETAGDGSFSIPTNYTGPFVVSADCDGYFFEVFDDKLFFDDGAVHQTTSGKVTALGKMGISKAPALDRSLVSHFGDDWSVWPSIDNNGSSLKLDIFGHPSRRLAAPPPTSATLTDISRPLRSLPMLITFRSGAYADITMFGDIAKQLIRLTGHSVVVPGAILADDVPEALAQLKKGLQDPPQAADVTSKTDRLSEQEEPPAIGLAKRAFPLLEMLEAAARDGKDVMWDKT